MKYLFFFIFFLLSHSGFAQKDSIAFTPHWKKGDVLKYKVSTTKSDYSQTRLMNRQISSYVVTVVVTRASEDLYEFEWKCENAMISGKPLSPLYKPVIDKYKYLTIKYQTNGRGVFQHITNLDEQTAMVNEIGRVSAEEAKNDPRMTPALLEEARKHKSPQTVEDLLTKEIKLVHWTMDKKFPINDTVRYKTEMADFFTKDPAKASGKVYIDSVNNQSGDVHITRILTADNEESKKMLFTLLDRMVPLPASLSPSDIEIRSRQIKAASASLKFDLKEDGRFICNYKKGYPIILVNSTKATITTPQSVEIKEEVTEITRVN